MSVDAAVLATCDAGNRAWPSATYVCGTVSTATAVRVSRSAPARGRALSFSSWRALNASFVFFYGSFCLSGFGGLIDIMHIRTSGQFHLAVAELGQVSLGIINEMDFNFDVHYKWWDEPVKPTYIRK